MSTITLDAILLNQMGSYSQSEFSNILGVMYDKSKARFGSSDNKSCEKAEDVKKIALKFSAIFLATISALSARSAFNKGTDQELIHLLSCYVASRAIPQLYEQEGSQAGIENTILDPKGIKDFSLEFKRREQSVLDAILNQYSDYISQGTPLSNVKAESYNFFNYLAKKSAELVLNEKYSKYSKILENLVINGPSFSIAGISKEEPKNGRNKSFVSGDEQIKKDFKVIEITDDLRVYRKDIVGNEEAVAEIEIAVKNVMAYRKDDQANPFLEGRKKKGFNQGLLLMGDTGTGKTLVARYGMSLADEIARKYGKELSIVKFDIMSTYQEGGVIMLQHQLSQVCQGDKIYYLSIDEIDSMFTSRSEGSADSHYHREKLGEILRFLDGDYPNKGNYIVVATVNNIKGVDRALRNARLDRIHCPGPCSAEDKAKVIAIHFGDEIKKGLVNVVNWTRIGEAAVKYNINGRQLADVANKCYKIMRNLSDKHYHAIYSATTISESREILHNSATPIADSIIMDQIMKIAKKDSEEQRVTYDFMGKTGGE
jgi:SpoVK/Ycf46/Vps4 family AAA+-type ATPase